MSFGNSPQFYYQHDTFAIGISLVKTHMKIYFCSSILFEKQKKNPCTCTMMYYNGCKSTLNVFKISLRYILVTNSFENTFTQLVFLLYYLIFDGCI